MIRTAVLLAALAWPAMALAALADEKLADGGTLRVLDRMTDQVQDLHLASGGAGTVGRLTVTLDECRYPEGEPAASIGHLTIQDSEAAAVVFAGWVSAASPALNALDHPRYDAWLLACDGPAAPETPAEAPAAQQGG